jgi:hypothetical protein
MSICSTTTSTLLRSIIYFVGGGGGRVESYEYESREDGQEELESVERFIEDKAFSLSHGLTPPQPPPSSSPVRKLSLFFGLSVCRRSIF